MATSYPPVIYVTFKALLDWVREGQTPGVLVILLAFLEFVFLVKEREVRT